MMPVSNDPASTLRPVAAPALGPGRWRALCFAAYALVLIVLFIQPILGLAAYASRVNLHSHILLIPFISGYLILLQRRQLRAELQRPILERARAALPLLGAALSLGAYYALGAPGGMLPLADAYFLLIVGLVNLLIAGAILLLGWDLVRVVAFPSVFLFFSAPLPEVAVEALEVFFQQASASASAALFALSGTPVYREGLKFALPGLTIEVAQQCSGIRSSLVLFITSLAAGYMFLRQPSHRLILALAVIPLGIVRNAFRICVVALLTVHVDPAIVHGPLHKRGGPIFFLLSLIPFLLLLFFLRRRELRRHRPAGAD